METILVLTDDAEQLTVGIGIHIHSIYPTAQLMVRRLDADLLSELMHLSVNTLPKLILVDSCVDSLPLLKELKSHSSLYRIPILMLRADATQRKAQVDMTGEIFPRRTVFEINQSVN